MSPEDIEWIEVSRERVRLDNNSIYVATHIANIPGGTLIRSVTYKYQSGASVDVTFIPHTHNSKSN